MSELHSPLIAHGAVETESGVQNIRATGNTMNCRIWRIDFVNRYNYALDCLLDSSDKMGLVTSPIWPLFFPYHAPCSLSFFLNFWISAGLLVMFLFDAVITYVLACKMKTGNTFLQRDSSCGSISDPRAVTIIMIVHASVAAYMLIIFAVNHFRARRTLGYDICNIHMGRHLGLSTTNEFLAIDVATRTRVGLGVVDNNSALFAFAQQTSVRTLRVHVFQESWNSMFKFVVDNWFVYWFFFAGVAIANVVLYWRIGFPWL